MALLADREARIFDGAKRAGRFFMKEGDVHQTLERVVRDLEEIGVPYALVGAMALNEYGYRRLTEDVVASGISAPHRLKDLADVLEVIRAKQLPRELASELDPYVQQKYIELWTAAQQAGDDER